jgi:hypothetical protein
MSKRRMKCEHEDCDQPYETVDASFGFVCGLHRQHPLRVGLKETGRNLSDVDVMDMTEGELDASLGHLLTAVAAKQSDAWAAQRDAAQWKAYAEWLRDMPAMSEALFWSYAKKRDIDS